MKDITPNKPRELGVQTISKPNVQRVAHISDRDRAKRLRYLYKEANAGLRKVIALGLFLFDLQENHLKHGQFQTWCEANVPEIKYRAIAGYKQITKNVLEACGMQINESLPLADSGKFLLCKVSTLSGPALDLRNRICEVIDGKTTRQLMLEFKQCDDTGRVKIGRMPGEGGKPQLAFAQKAELEKACAEKDCTEVVTILNAVASRFMLCSDKTLALLEATLDRHVRAIRAWQKQPLRSKQPDLIQAMFMSSLTPTLPMELPALPAASDAV